MADQSASSRLPARHILELQKERQEECPICYVAFVESLCGITHTICGHLFCTDCQTTWEASSKLCAMCRSPLLPPKPEYRDHSIPPYEWPQDSRFPCHFGSRENMAIVNWQDEDMICRQEALFTEAWHRLNAEVVVETWYQDLEIDAPPWFSVRIPSEDPFLGKYDPPCERIWLRIHDELTEIIKKHFGDFECFEEPVIRYFCNYGKVEYPDDYQSLWN